tara:strand:- start:734 stop:1627 length:894 start_codon:yes stop_codon:yes gene_type:complete
MSSANEDDAADKEPDFHIVDFRAGPPRRARSALTSVWFRASDGRKIYLPRHAVHRRGTPLPRHQRPFACDCAHGLACARGWKVMGWEHITVVLVLNEHGLRVAGWFVQFLAPPSALIRVPATIVAALIDTLPRDAEAWEFPDASIATPESDFLALAEARYANLVAPDRAVAQRTRSGTASPPPPAPSRWAPFAPPPTDTTERPGECVVCYEECEVHVPACCGVSAAMCAGCHTQARGVCIVCQRGYVSAEYTCTCCGKGDVAFTDYGFACALCEARVLCAACCDADGACAACDPLRG